MVCKKCIKTVLRTVTPITGFVTMSGNIVLLMRQMLEDVEMFSTEVSQETFVYHPAMVYFQELYLCGKVFTEPLLSSGWFPDCD
jgi:hypothetical protein